mmetsp:Transcript_11167/g.25274  ORF Transcript_11167/g.25274 Transcript_11167/m.25274 type:complete len:317 (+) Transcript_11167:665-1615(+)
MTIFSSTSSLGLARWQPQARTMTIKSSAITLGSTAASSIQNPRNRHRHHHCHRRCHLHRYLHQTQPHRNVHLPSRICRRRHPHLLRCRSHSRHHHIIIIIIHTTTTSMSHHHNHRHNNHNHNHPQQTRTISAGARDSSCEWNSCSSPRFGGAPRRSQVFPTSTACCTPRTCTRRCPIPCCNFSETASTTCCTAHSSRCRCSLFHHPLSQPRPFRASASTFLPLTSAVLPVRLRRACTRWSGPIVRSASAVATSRTSSWSSSAVLRGANAVAAAANMWRISGSRTTTARHLPGRMRTSRRRNDRRDAVVSTSTLCHL